MKSKIQTCPIVYINIVTTSMGDEKALRVRPTRSSFSNNVQPPQAQVETIGNTIAFGWANDIISLAYSLAYICKYKYKYNCLWVGI